MIRSSEWIDDDARLCGWLLGFPWLKLWTSKLGTKLYSNDIEANLWLHQYLDEVWLMRIDNVRLKESGDLVSVQSSIDIYSEKIGVWL